MVKDLYMIPLKLITCIGLKKLLANLPRKKNTGEDWKHVFLFELLRCFENDNVDPVRKMLRNNITCGGGSM